MEREIDDDNIITGNCGREGVAKQILIKLKKYKII